MIKTGSNMAKRPRLSDDSFLKHLFSPAKNPLPTGIRKRSLKGTRGRDKARLAAYNRMSGANQELLKRSGLREAYLKGDASLQDAKHALRPEAVRRGIAKGLRPVLPTPGRSLDDQVAGYVYRTVTGDRRPTVNYNTIRKNVTHLPPGVKPDVLNWTPGKIKAYAADTANVIDVDGTQINPLWYH